MSKNTVNATIAPVQSADIHEVALGEQAVRLSKLSKDILRKSTMRGVAVGAVLGCGLSAVSASGAGRCAQAAVVGGAVGGVIGHANGRKQVEQRMALVDLNRVMPAISKADDQMTTLQSTLDAMLAAQSAELETLKRQRKTGEITPDSYQARLTEIRDIRAKAAEALLLSARDLAEARIALENAEKQGQPGIAWYLQKTRKLEQHATSARSSLSLI
ncbi:hypothetical protein [Thalassococcus lentus]|uniref:Glycine zipper domain-containing protein n=1 Tax=Thalassococcus lentus TaxID=1210524 RepID=A0ABT4XNM2_9RHOB|nr:hypothetical protein [Thalassococcus lentus]MDA7423463.1 hypothetical protein [Thalassococcus lentus]